MCESVGRPWSKLEKRGANFTELAKFRMFSLIVVLIDRQGTEEGEEGTSQKLRRDPRCSTFFLSFHVTTDEYSRAWKISISLNQGGQIFVETGSRNRALPPPFPRIRLLLRRRYNNFLHRGRGRGRGHQTGNGFISRFLRATSGVSDFTLKTLSFVVSLFRRDVRDFRYTRRKVPMEKHGVSAI